MKISKQISAPTSHTSEVWRGEIPSTKPNPNRKIGSNKTMPEDQNDKPTSRTPRKSKALLEAETEIKSLQEQLEKSEKAYQAEADLATQLELEKTKWEKRKNELEESLKKYKEANEEFQRENDRLQGQIIGLESGRKKQTAMQLVCITIALGLGFLSLFKK